MKTKNKRLSHRKMTLIIILGLVIITAGIAIYYEYSESKTDRSNVRSITKNESKEDNLESKTDPTSDNSSSAAYPKQKKAITNTDPQAPTTIDKTTGKTTVTVVTSASVSGDTVYIRGGINNAVSEGKCYAQLKGPSGSSIKKDTTLLPGAATADCKTIKIPVSELSPGTWIYKLNYSSPTAEGVSSENSFQIN